MSYPLFDRNQLVFKKLAERKNKIKIERDFIPVSQKPSGISDNDQLIIEKVVARIKSARERNSSVILAFGAHTIKNCLSPVLIALLEKGWITHMATNGAGLIHDWEFAFQGESSEDVRVNVAIGEFGLWEETGFWINLAIQVGAYEGIGYGESIGKMIYNEGLKIPRISELHEAVINNISKNPDLAASALDLSGTMQRYGILEGYLKIDHPYKRYSVQAAAYKLRIPFTGHPMIGHDIIYNHPLNNGAAVGRTSLRDYLYYSNSVSNIDHGVYISLGSAVMSPMIFEKALSMSQNLKIQQGRHIDNHYMLVVDLAKSGWDWNKNGEPPSDNPDYYLRFCKTFNRMGGEMDYMSADNRDFLLSLYQKLNEG